MATCTGASSPGRKYILMIRHITIVDPDESVAWAVCCPVATKFLHVGDRPDVEKLVTRVEGQPGDCILFSGALCWFTVPALLHPLLHL